MGVAQPQTADQRYKAFLNQYLEARKSLYAFIFVLTRNGADADDIFQDTSSILWRKFDQFEEGTNFLAWAKQVARNLVMDHRKKRSRRPVVDLDEQTVDLLAFRYQRIQDQVEDRMEAVKRCMQKLDESDRSLVKETYEEGKAIKKIAKAAKVSVQRIYQRLGGIHGILLRCVRRTMDTRGASR